jgi:hypothetical protein
MSTLRRILPSLALALWLVTAARASAGGTMPVTFDESRSGVPLNIRSFRLRFSEEFDGPVSLRGPRLFAPVHAPFGAGRFDGPEGRAYAVVAETGDEGERPVSALRITAYKDATGWRSGNVQTADSAQAYQQAPFGRRGFACRDCYFEARLKFPEAAEGYWAGFWLLSPHDKKKGHVEVDIIEWYGGDPKGHHQSIHLWPASPHKQAYKSNYVGMNGIINDGRWHTYGALKTGGDIIFYVDRREISRVHVEKGFNVPLFPVVTLVINAPEAEKAASPMVLYVDYLRAYSP